MNLSRHLFSLAVAAVTATAPLHAAEWSYEPKLSLRMGYNDNIRLTSGQHDSVWEAALKPSVKFGVAQENRGLSGDTGLSLRRFRGGGSGQDSRRVLDREDYFFNTDAWYNGLRDTLKASLDYRRDSTLDSELDDSGNVVDRATREKLTLTPSWSRLLTEVTRLDLTYEFSTVDYTDDPGQPDLVSYDYHVASASLTHQLSPRMQGVISAGFSGFKPETDFNSDTVSLQAGLIFNFSENLESSFLVGQRRTTSDANITGFCVGANPGATYPTCEGGIPVPTGSTKTEVETDSAVFSASITRTLETGSLSASLTRSSSPSSIGELLDATRLVLTGEHRFTETLRSSLRVEYTENETIVNQVGFTPDAEKETFFRVTPRIAWRLARDWTLAGEYQYVDNDDPVFGTAKRDAIYFMLTYKPSKRSVSR